VSSGVCALWCASVGCLWAPVLNVYFCAVFASIYTRLPLPAPTSGCTSIRPHIHLHAPTVRFPFAPAAEHRLNGPDLVSVAGKRRLHSQRTGSLAACDRATDGGLTGFASRSGEERGAGRSPGAKCRRLCGSQVPITTRRPLRPASCAAKARLPYGLLLRIAGLARLLRKASDTGNTVYFVKRANSRRASLVDGDWKFTMLIEPPEEHLRRPGRQLRVEDFDELFDLSMDPLEQNNLLQHGNISDPVHLRQWKKYAALVEMWFGMADCVYQEQFSSLTMHPFCRTVHLHLYRGDQGRLQR